MKSGNRAHVIAVALIAVAHMTVVQTDNKGGILIISINC